MINHWQNIIVLSLPLPRSTICVASLHNFDEIIISSWHSPLLCFLHPFPQPPVSWKSKSRLFFFLTQNPSVHTLLFNHSLYLLPPLSDVSCLSSEIFNLYAKATWESSPTQLECLMYRAESGRLYKLIWCAATGQLWGRLLVGFLMKE